MTPTEDSDTRARPLRRGEWRLLAVLGLPGFCLAAAITTVSTYLPVIASRFTGSSTVVGLLIAAEGMLALFLPLAIGAWSDRIDGPIGGRLPFVLVATPVLAVTLVLMALAGGIVVMGVWVSLFFAAYFVAYEPYRALYPDLVDTEVAGRGQSAQAAARGLGTVLALASGGVLLSVADVLPFAIAAGVVLASMALFAHLLLTRRMHERADGGDGAPATDALRRIRQLLAEHRGLRPFMAANALWELTLAAVKTFVVLYITKGLGYSLAASSAIIGGTSVILLGAALASGRLADRFGTARVMRWALVVYGIGLVVPFVTSTPGVIAAMLPLIAFGGGVLMSLPYALLIPMMPRGDHGTVTGFYGMSRGIGVMLGPLLAGAAIDAGLTPAGAGGYPAVWGVAALATLASLPFLRAVERRAGADAAA